MMSHVLVLVFALSRGCAAGWFDGRRNAATDLGRSAAMDVLIDHDLAVKDAAMRCENAEVECRQLLEVCSDEVHALRTTVQQLRTALIITVLLLVAASACAYVLMLKPTPKHKHKHKHEPEVVSVAVSTECKRDLCVSPNIIEDALRIEYRESCTKCNNPIILSKYKEFCNLQVVVQDLVSLVNHLLCEYTRYCERFPGCGRCDPTNDMAFELAMGHLRTCLEAVFAIQNKTNYETHYSNIEDQPSSPNSCSSEYPYHYPEIVAKDADAGSNTSSTFEEFLTTIDSA